MLLFLFLQIKEFYKVYFPLNIVILFIFLKHSHYIVYFPSNLVILFSIKYHYSILLILFVENSHSILFPFLSSIVILFCLFSLKYRDSILSISHEISPFKLC